MFNLSSILTRNQIITFRSNGYLSVLNTHVWQFLYEAARTLFAAANCDIELWFTLIATNVNR